MIDNNFNDITSINNYDSIIPKQFINYVCYKLDLFEKITNKKFCFNISTDRFELNVCKRTKDDNDIDDKNNKQKYQLVYRANNLNQFIKRLFMIREHLIRNFG